jgi:hypothetical protein
MELRPGLRLESATCDTQVVVVKAPKDAADVEVCCGGAPMRAVDAGGDRLPATGGGEPTLLGKRYADDELGLELLCTRGGVGTLSVGGRPLLQRGAKPLPSSD